MGKHRSVRCGPTETPLLQADAIGSGRSERCAGGISNACIRSAFMDVIASIVSLVLTFVAGVIGNIVAHDICATADARCAKIIGRAAKRLAPVDIETTELEWLADLA